MAFWNKKDKTQENIKKYYISLKANIDIIKVHTETLEKTINPTDLNNEKNQKDFSNYNKEYTEFLKGLNIFFQFFTQNNHINKTKTITEYIKKATKITFDNNIKTKSHKISEELKAFKENLRNANKLDKKSQEKTEK